ncbi:MAG: SpoIIIAH-like family protein [Clostridia bacterium]|nr:SpoIIIAH-like family protein [Clostridia bacterium]
MSRNQKFKFKGKQVLLLGLVALVITAGYYRWTVETENLETVPVTGEALPVNYEQSQNQEQGEQQETQESEGQMQSQGIVQLKQERDKARSESMEQWQKTAQNKEASQESKSEAEKKVKSANEWTEKEKNIETLVKAKGYTDCFAHINDSGISVVVSGGEVNGAKVAQIKDIIVSETNIPVRNIKISAE